ncbi:hypothetical protein CDA63_11890 [Hymenobacter amundsenii]|uniref:Helix-turn-helix domain-containing protein n=1 Tax=Hymenobacter amundsenii TaxID=2006685 RepID=A0A246FMT0_9BACT|nr:helix-turn-helix domain-containing protein [Hymenobacter amundsenii]OWP62913.1 hypothetical protein CDA63_11890 [Hymenobacter amundsenii]
MRPDELATKADLEQLFARMAQLLATPAAPATGPDEYLTLEEVATATRVSTRTVKKWVQEGKADRRGKLVQLFALEFSPGFLRIPRAALLAYGEGIGFTIHDLKEMPRMRVAS